MQGEEDRGYRRNPKKIVKESTFFMKS